MKHPDQPISPEVRALLDRERAIPPQSAAVRARAMARARAALLTRESAAQVAQPRATPRGRWAAAAAVVCVASAALAAAAYVVRARHAPSPAARPAVRPLEVTPTPLRPPVAADPIAGARPTPMPTAPPVSVGATTDARPAPVRASGAPRLSQADAIRAELRLLRQARAAVGREDFAAALTPIAEHARRFKDGRMAEEREALRVKALAGLGRTEEARRAAASFRAHFPHSVLVPAVGRMPASEP